MGIRKWGALLSWVALPSFIVGFHSLGNIASSGSALAVSSPAVPSLPDETLRALRLRPASVTPGSLAVHLPGEAVWRSEEAPVVENRPAEPAIPLPDRVPLPAPGASGEAPPPDQGAMPEVGPSTGGAPAGLDAEVLLADPRIRAEMLDRLYDALSTSSDAQAASRLQEAIEKIWLRTGSPTIDLLLGRAILLGQDGDYELALEILNAAISLSPDTAEVWHQRAMVRFLREEHSEALSDLRRTLALDPKHYEAISGLGRVLEHLGQKESALAVFRRALQINPYLEPARLAVGELSREIEGQDI